MTIPRPSELWAHPDKAVRDFGKALALVLAGIGLWLTHRAGAHPGTPGAGLLARAWAVAGPWWAGATVILALSLASPPALRPLYVALTLVGACLGFVLGHAMLIATYLTLFVIIGRFRRSSSPITLGFDRSAPTYWKKHEPIGGPDRYYRQY